MHQHAQHSDCGIVGQRQRFKSQLASIAAASPQSWETDAEAVMQVGQQNALLWMFGICICAFIYIVQSPMPAGLAQSSFRSWL
jgi:hypothetical protein